MQSFLHAIDMDMVELIHVSTLKEWLDYQQGHRLIRFEPRHFASLPETAVMLSLWRVNDYISFGYTDVGLTIITSR